MSQAPPVIFTTDDVVKALLRLAVVYNIPTACNLATAGFMISSELMRTSYDRRLVDSASRVGGDAVGQG